MVTLLPLLLAATGVLASGICAEGPYQYLALEGGGVRGIAYAGVVQALDDAGVLSQMQGFAGTSAGSIGATLLAAGYTGAEVAEELRSLDFRRFLESSGSSIVDLSRFMATFGWYSSDPIQRLVDDMLARKLGVSNVTFSQLHAATGKELRVTAVSMNTGALVFFDHLSHGDVPVSQAVRASCSIPLFFRPVPIGAQLYVDGGVSRSLPMDAFAADAAAIGAATLGVSLMRDGRHSTVRVVPHFASLPEFALQLASIFVGGATRTAGDYAHDDSASDLVSLNVSTVDPVDFSLCDAQQRFLVSTGYNAVADALVACGKALESQLRRPPRDPPQSCASGEEVAASLDAGDGGVQLAAGSLTLQSVVEEGLLDQVLRAVQAHRQALLILTSLGMAASLGLTMLLGLILWRWLKTGTCRRPQLPDSSGADVALPDVAQLSDEDCASLQMQVSREMCNRLLQKQKVQ